MKALVFGVKPGPHGDAPPLEANHLVQNLFRTPMDLNEIDDPKLLGDDWVILKNRITGICGSDSKQVFGDMGGESDVTMTAFISFPHVLGHEVIADVAAIGPKAKGVEVGQRVALNCWLTCAPRGIDPICPQCAAGNLSQCWNFTDGRITPGIHTGNSSDATGGFAPYLPAHDSMAIPVPDDVPDEIAVLADPFAVSLHAILNNPPPPHGRAVVWGAGALGTSAVAILKSLYPTVEVAAIVRHPAQQEMARKLGAFVIGSEQEPEAIVVALAEWSEARLLKPWEGLPIAHPGKIDNIYDSIASPATLEQGLRVIGSRGTICVTGVHGPGAFMWGPWYFKEARLVGSNAFGIETVDGVRKHAIAHYLDMVQDGRIDISPMLTHTFRLEQWRDAFTTIANQHETGAIKVAFDYR
jgi:threonine dehydrogenase-like Zn-dependent dehydrogenase